MLQALAPGVLWVAALLATMLSLNRMFANDYADGTLEQLLLAPHPLSILVLAKVDVSLAYPFVGVGFIVTMVLGWLLLQEPVGLTRITGTLLVAIGAYLVAQS